MPSTLLDMANNRIASLMLHTSPLEQAGIGDAGGLNVYVVESAGSRPGGSRYCAS